MSPFAHCFCCTLIANRTLHLLNDQLFLRHSRFDRLFMSQVKSMLRDIAYNSFANWMKKFTGSNPEIGSPEQALISSPVLYLLSRNEKDLMLGFFQALLGARYLDEIAGVVWSRDLDLGGSLELKLLQLLPIFADDKAMMFLGDGHIS